MTKKMKMAEAKSLAQKIAFAPFTFQAIKTLVDLQILAAIDKHTPQGITDTELEKELNLNHYTVSTLLEVALFADVVAKENKKYTITKVGQCFLYDTMTQVNMDFVNDVCYKGMFDLKESFLTQSPKGLKNFGTWPTIYEGLSSLPKQVQKSWFAFDHFYSDNTFDKVIEIILASEPKRVFDIGCNTGKFELAFLKQGFKGEMILIDLPQQLEKAKENLKANNLDKFCQYHPVNILSAEAKLPQNPDIVFMSQFLDCFSTEQIQGILNKVKEVMTATSKVYILEPFWDKQSFEAAKLSLTNISLYFTALANGKSKMYSQEEMQTCVEKTGLKLAKIYDKIGPFEYTLMEITK